MQQPDGLQRVGSQLLALVITSRGVVLGLPQAQERTKAGRLQEAVREPGHVLETQVTDCTAVQQRAQLDSVSSSGTVTLM